MFRFLPPGARMKVQSVLYFEFTMMESKSYSMGGEV